MAASDLALKHAAKRKCPAGTLSVAFMRVTLGRGIVVRRLRTRRSLDRFPRDRYQRTRLPPQDRSAACRLSMTILARPGAW